MATPAPFSRLQLAAALIEYDNDPNNPEAPYRSAQESAIFSNFRRMQLRGAGPRKSDFLNVALPSDPGSLNGRESALSGRKSRSSINMLRNPFGADESVDYDYDEDGDEGEEGGMEVDLTSWGLDAFIEKEKDPKVSKRSSRRSTLPNPHPIQSVRSQTMNTAPRRTMRSMSVGNMDQMVNLEDENRRKSFGSPVDLLNVEPISFPRHRSMSQSFSQPPAGFSGNTQSIPFPTGSVRSPSPGPGQFPDDDFKGDPRASTFTSKFDPKAYQTGADDNNPFALRPPSMMSKFDPKGAAHARTMSNASMGSRMMLDDASVMTGLGRERRYSTAELLRPKVLVMPSPLQQSTSNPVMATPSAQSRDGFLSSVDPPLPPGARSTRRGSALDPSPSNLFTPNPRANLTLSQLTFRNTLMVDGQRDVTYQDIDGDIPRAMEDGVQMQLTAPPPEFPEEPQLMPPSEDHKPAKPAGKLFGKSLIDDLESRKLEMKSKQRVFAGDARPTMMARTSAQRQSTLIDPASLQVKPGSSSRPVTQHLGSFESQGSQQALGRRGSINAKPLLSFDEDDKLRRPMPNFVGRTPNNRSVFGVDTLWEREMVKLKALEAQEKEAEAVRKAQEAAEEEVPDRKRGGKKGKGKNKGREPSLSPAPPLTPSESVEERLPSAPPVLPAISPRLRAPPPVNNDSDSDESDGGGPSKAPAKGNAWNSSDDEETGPRRTTGTGPRYPNKGPAQMADEDSEEDMPLAATVDRAVQRATQLQAAHDASDSDEEQPLSQLLQQNKISLPSINFDRRNQEEGEEEEDDEPLGVRASRLVPSFHGSVQGGGDDDETPLAFHPEQQRRSQYQMMAQAQVQHQQMMMQAQSMFFSPQPMMAPGFFGPPPMMMQPPMSMVSGHEEAKYGAVDRWRKEVVADEP
ncbi:unnamed protein product [Mycena citricolor]|uniref:Uncharacterized protein n=1 Tax=Mycena citricolor TaxID=2018698 RepID=A0AAD2HIJ3_9AGAR|nr:unnamed protein product [Mycena citricolor]CAK5275553.1 unnamed protein product [Mycena citricolor]